MKSKNCQLLYQNLFKIGDRNTTLMRLSEGLCAFAKNAVSLLEDAEFLANARRYIRADFLVATAAEEIAKTYILLDMCRLDFKKKENVLIRLCRAFYYHVEKRAYYKVALFNSDRGFCNMTQVEEKFRTELIRLWPSHDIELGEPDMLHEVYFKRELNLYVDFSDYDKNWIIVTPEVKALEFETFKSSSPILSCRKVLDNILDTLKEGLFKPEILGTFNEIFEKETITKNTPINQLIGIYSAMGRRIEDSFGIGKEKFEKSTLKGYPLYQFLESN